MAYAVRSNLQCGTQVACPSEGCPCSFTSLSLRVLFNPQRTKQATCLTVRACKEHASWFSRRLRWWFPKAPEAPSLPTFKASYRSIEACPPRVCQSQTQILNGRIIFDHCGADCIRKSDTSITT